MRRLSLCAGCGGYTTPPHARTEEDPLVFLSAPTGIVVERIRRRNRGFELQIDPGYYSAVNEAYEEYFDRYTGGKLRIPMDTWDFVKRPELFSELSRLIDEALARR